MKKLAIAVIVAAGLAFGWGGSSSAAPIACPGAQTAVHTPADGWYCENPAGHLAPGQQPTCSGSSHDQESENQNPAGHAPGGHN